MLKGCGIVYHLFTKTIINPNYLTSRIIKQSLPPDVVTLFGENIQKYYNVCVDGTDIRISKPSDFDLSSLTRSEKSKKWCVRVLCYTALNGRVLNTLPVEGCLVTGRHNDSGMFDYFHCSNYQNINALFPPSMFVCIIHYLVVIKVFVY